MSEPRDPTAPPATFPSPPTLPIVTVRYWAAARAAAGIAEEPSRGLHLADVVAELRARHGQPLAGILERCSFLVDGGDGALRAHPATPLRDGAVVEVLPPFAGGAKSRP